MRVIQFEGLADQHLVTLFQEARGSEYAELDAEATELEEAIAKTAVVDHPEALAALARLRRRYAEIRRVDYFDTPVGMRVETKLNALQRMLTPHQIQAIISPATLAAYRHKQWVTRPRPHVDRLACIWLIRRFIDRDATIRYSESPMPEEIAFDMSDGGHFGHHGNLCTFEMMIATFGLVEQALQPLGEIVHEIDLRDELYTRPETAGIDALLSGWLREGISDSELEQRGIALFSGLYAAFSHEATATRS